MGEGVNPILPGKKHPVIIFTIDNHFLNIKQVTLEIKTGLLVPGQNQIVSLHIFLHKIYGHLNAY